MLSVSSIYIQNGMGYLHSHSKMERDIKYPNPFWNEIAINQLENEIRPQYILMKIKYIQTQSGMWYQTRCIDSPFTYSYSKMERDSKYRNPFWIEISNKMYRVPYWSIRKWNKISIYLNVDQTYPNPKWNVIADEMYRFPFWPIPKWN